MTPRVEVPMILKAVAVGLAIAAVVLNVTGGGTDDTVLTLQGLGLAALAVATLTPPADKR